MCLTFESEFRIKYTISGVEMTSIVFSTEVNTNHCSWSKLRFAFRIRTL